MDEEWLHERNIERFRAQLAGAPDSPQRKVLSRLLAEEQRLLDRLRQARRPDGRGGGGDPLPSRVDE